ncbi:MAG: hypothetical protein AAB965_02075 [Patescibacteria group bacterium]
MSNWRTERRLFYLFIVLGFFLAVFLFIYYAFIQKPVSCFDSAKNQDELGVDCGGMCSKVCSSEVSPLVKRWTVFFKTSEGQYDVAALVDNPNFGFGLRALNYTVTLFDKTNYVIVSKEGVTFANPSETFLIFENGLSSGQRTPVKAILEFTGDPVWIRVPAKVTMPKMTVQNMSLDEGALPHLTAELKNESDLDLSDIDVTAVIYDDEDNAIAVSSTFVNYIGRGEAQNIGFTWPESFSGKAAVKQISPRLNIVPIGQ